MREVELLVEVGFTPLEAIKIPSLNGAKFLGEDAPSARLLRKASRLAGRERKRGAKQQRNRKVEIALKDGVGYDSEKLIQSVQGLVEIR